MPIRKAIPCTVCIVVQEETKSIPSRLFYVQFVKVACGSRNFRGSFVKDILGLALDKSDIEQMFDSVRG